MICPRTNEECDDQQDYECARDCYETMRRIEIREREAAQ